MLKTWNRMMNRLRHAKARYEVGSMLGDNQRNRAIRLERPHQSTREMERRKRQEAKMDVMVTIRATGLGINYLDIPDVPRKRQNRICNSFERRYGGLAMRADQMQPGEHINDEFQTELRYL